MRIVKYSLTQFGIPTEVVRTVEAGRYAVILQISTPPDYVGFLYSLTIDHYEPNIYYDLVIDGSLEERIEREGQIKYDPPIVFHTLQIAVGNHTNRSVPAGVRLNGIFAKKEE